MKRLGYFVAFVALCAVTVWVCTREPSPDMTTPQISGASTASQSTADPSLALGIYNWQDIPINQRVLVSRATFDQDGFQIYAVTGETIIVPFIAQNLYAMKFGRSETGQNYFVNEGPNPTLYLPKDASLANTSVKGARWVPIPPDAPLNSPIFVTLAPSWLEWRTMGWYPGMTVYGGLYGSTPGAASLWTPGFAIAVGKTRFTNYTAYHDYYSAHPGYETVRVVYDYSAPRATAAFGSAGSSGSFGAFSGGSMGGSVGGGRSSDSLRESDRDSLRSRRMGGSLDGGRSGDTFGSADSTSAFDRNGSSGSFGANGRSTSSARERLPLDSADDTTGGGERKGFGSSFDSTRRGEFSSSYDSTRNSRTTGPSRYRPGSSATDANSFDDPFGTAKVTDPFGRTKTKDPFNNPFAKKDAAASASSGGKAASKSSDKGSGKSATSSSGLPSTNPLSGGYSSTNPLGKLPSDTSTGGKSSSGSSSSGGSSSGSSTGSGNSSSSGSSTNGSSSGSGGTTGR